MTFPEESYYYPQFTEKKLYLLKLTWLETEYII